jgi:hypothetical protein
LPAVTAVQVPRLPTTAHDMQVPVQVDVQQTPSVQIPLTHSSLPLHELPGGLSPHVPLLQTAGAAQSALEAQVERQEGTTSQRYGKQEDAAGITQTPAPSQVAVGVSVVVPLSQVAFRHAVPCSYRWQLPALQSPLVPQVAVACTTQISAGSGALLATFAQVPFEAGSAHDLQASLQAVVQQTPWAQMFEAHSLLSEQMAPGGFLPHELSLQTFPGAQLASMVQLMKQRLPLQANGAQAAASGATQAPLAVQSAAGVETPDSQRSAPHMVPTGYLRQPPPPSQRPSVPQAVGPRSMQMPR